jgi:aromatic ring-opening dioxygenase LigB subunit
MAGIIFGCLVPHPPLMVPDVGKGQERAISATIQSLEEVADLIAERKPETALVISPHGDTHVDAMGILAQESFTGNMFVWGSRLPERKFTNDLEMVRLIEVESKADGIPITNIGGSGYELDWGVMAPLHFLYRGLEGVPLIELTFSFLPLETHFNYGKAIQRAAEKRNKRVLLIASGDLSHRLIPEAPAGYDPMGKIFDQQLADALSKMDADGVLKMDRELISRAGECGLRSAVILLGALDGLKVQPKIHSYEGPFGVGYLVASFDVVG